MSNGLERTGECKTCGECCKKVRITSLLSHIIEQHGSIEEAGKYYLYRGINIAKVHEESDRVLLEIGIPCDRLAEDNKCLVHGSPEKKPLICHRYPWFSDDIESCGYSFTRKKQDFLKWF